MRSGTTQRRQTDPRIGVDVPVRSFSKRRFRVDNPGSIHGVYQIGERLGKGSFATVRRATQLETRVEYAVKAVPKLTRSMKRNAKIARCTSTANAAVTEYGRQIEREIDVMKSMEHPNIVRLVETFEDEDSILLVMELCAGGELFDPIIENDYLAERQAALLMTQIFLAVEYMHERSVVHRDIKPANLLYETRGSIETSVLKLIDFGLSATVSPDQALRATNGTPFYMAPQVLKGTSYDSAADLWSCGVIMYVMLCGYPPFYGNRSSEVTAKVTKGNYSFNEADWREVSLSSRDLIRQLLKMLPKERLSAKEALEHRWIREMSDDVDGKELPTQVVSKLRNFKSQCRGECDDPAADLPVRQRGVAKADRIKPRLLPQGSELLELFQMWIPSGMFCNADAGCCTERGEYTIFRQGHGTSYTAEVLEWGNVDGVKVGGASLGLEERVRQVNGHRTPRR